MSSEQEKTESELEVEANPQTAANQTEADTEMPEIEAIDPQVLIAQLEKDLEAANNKAQENWDKMLRIQAEMENLKRRTQKDLEDARKYAIERFAKELLAVADSLELGLQAISGESDEVKKFREGSELTLKQFETAFSKVNIEKIDPAGEPFNPEFHQAMAMQPSADAPPNTVLNVFQKGYTLNGRLLRPAMVIVAKAVEPLENN